jgi:phage terminase large subunit GpA-like protein
MASAQVAKSETALSIILYYLSEDPSACMLVMPSSGVAESFSKERIAPAIQLTDGLSEMIPVKGRSSESTISYKPFTNGASLVMAGSESPSQLSSRPRRVIVADEIDKYPDSAGAEGDPVSLALKRSMTFMGRRKHVLISTPSVKGQSRIETAYLESDQRKYLVPCPKCGGMQTLTWNYIKWPEGHPELAVMVCSICSSEIDHTKKQWMLEHGEWRSHSVAKSKGTVGFHISELYSPWSTWGRMAEDFTVKLAQGPDIFRTWVNSSLGECWDPNAGTEAKAEGLVARARKCKYAQGIVPNEAGLIVGGGDVQEDAVHLLFQAVMPGGRAHVISHEVIQGNPGQVDFWNRIQARIKQAWRREDGVAMKCSRFAIDSGHHTKEVMAFCNRPGLAGIVIPIKGSSTAIQGMIKPSKRRSKLWLVDTVQVKDSMYADLRIDTEGSLGYQSFYNNVEPEFFHELMTERRVKKNNVRRYEVFPLGARNEGCDILAYCRVALRLFKLKPGELEQFAAHYTKKIEPKIEPKITEEVLPDTLTPLPTEEEPPRKGGFIRPTPKKRQRTSLGF